MTRLSTSACAVFLLVFTLFSGACQSEDNDFALKTIERLDSEVHALRLEVAALSTENSRLRARLLDQHLWTGLVQLDRVGNVSGDRPFVRVCPRGTLMTGARGGAGALVDRLVVVCSGVGEGQGQFSNIELTAAGGSGGERFERSCPPQTAVIGVRGGAGDAVDGIVLMCGPIDDPKAFQAAHPTPSALVEPEDGPEMPKKKNARKEKTIKKNLKRIGGGGGRPYSRRCPKSMVVAGISGMASNTLQSFALHCVRPNPPSESSSAIPTITKPQPISARKKEAEKPTPPKKKREGKEDAPVDDEKSPEDVKPEESSPPETPPSEDEDFKSKPSDDAL